MTSFNKIRNLPKKALCKGVQATGHLRTPSDERRRNRGSTPLASKWFIIRYLRKLDGLI
jgi:hypothetical protein